MARASRPGTQSVTPAKRAAAPTPPKQQWQYGPQAINDPYESFTNRPRQTFSEWAGRNVPNSQAQAAALGRMYGQSAAWQQRPQQRGQNLIVQPAYNPNMTANPMGSNAVFRQSLTRKATQPQGPIPLPGQQQPARAQYAPNQPQYQYGVAQQNQFYRQPGRQAFQVIPGAPQWLQNQVGQQQMGWGSGNTDLLSKAESDWWMWTNYDAKGEPYTPPNPDPGGGGYDGYGYGYGGGGGGGGYSKTPEWYERMINWKY